MYSIHKNSGTGKITGSFRILRIDVYKRQHLCGYVGEARKYTAKGIHDHPLAVSLLLEIDGVRLLFISIDVITLGGEKAAVIKDKIQKILTIENDHIIISAIHTHSGANGLEDMTMFGTCLLYTSKQCYN